MNRRGIATATAVIGLGTGVTSILGFVRASIVAHLFGAGVATDAFFAALTVPQMFYDQLIGGAISAVLIPTFSRLAAEDRSEMWLVVRTVLVLEVAVMLVVIGVLELLAHPLMELIASGFALKVHRDTLPLAVHLVRLLLPTLLFSALSAVALATLYSLGRRVVSAFAPSCYHLGIIAGAVLGAARWGIGALAAGAVAGAALQFAVQVPSLRRTGERRSQRRPLVDFRHPAIRRIIRLYIPVAAGITISIAGQIADINFKSHLPQSGDLTSMQYATQLVQFPVGVVAAALAYAVLPTISLDAERSLDAFKDTLALGMRLSLLLMVPAAAGLLVLGTPIVALVFQHGKFTPTGTAHTVAALTGYAPQLPFVGIDQLLIYAFYARHNTLTPALMGIVSVLVYVSSAALLLGPLTIIGLALANTLSIAVHTAVLFLLLLRVTGALRHRALPSTTIKVALAGAAMAVALWLTGRAFGPGVGLGERLAAVILPGVAGIAVYLAVIVVLRVDEIRLVIDTVGRRQARTSGT